MLKHKGLMAMLVCIMILGGCGAPKVGNNGPETSGTETSTAISEASGTSDKTQADGKTGYLPDFSTEKGIREYLVGEWIYDREYLNYYQLDPSDVLGKMIIDKDLNVFLSFEDKHTKESKGEYTGKIGFDRLYAKPNEAPDLIVIDLGDEGYPGGDYRFLHRTIYDGKTVMSLFFAGNGNHIFELLTTEDIAYYAIDEIILEKVSGKKSNLRPIKNEEFNAVFWGMGEDGKSLWLDKVDRILPSLEDDIYELNPRMNLYKDDVPESVLYKISANKMDEILSNNLVEGEVHFAVTDEKGYVIEFDNADYLDYIKYGDMPERDINDWFEDSGEGRKERVALKTGFELTKESGPFTIKVTRAEIFDYYIYDDFKYNYNDRDKVTVVSLEVEAKHNSSGNNYIYPNLAQLITNTKEEVEASYSVCDSVGDEFRGEEVKRGNVFFVLDSEAGDIKKIRYIISGAEDENSKKIGEDIEFKIDF